MQNKVFWHRTNGFQRDSGDYVVTRPHTLALRRLQASQAALMGDLFGASVEGWAFGVTMQGGGRGRSGRKGLLEVIL
jgi:hypothetical protein